IYTAEIIALRERVQKTTLRIIAMSLVMDDHFTAFIYRPGSDYIEYGDSMHQPPPSNILPLIQWVFSGICQPPISRIKHGFIAKQGPGSGEGSCGIIAHNFIEIAVGSHPEGVRRWNGSKSQLFRDAALQDLILYHYTATQTAGKFSSWTSDILDSSNTSMDGMEVNVSIGLGYNDFNNFGLLVSATFNELPSSKASQSELQSGLQLIQQPKVPTVDQLPSISTSLLPPFTLAVSQSVSAPFPRKVPSQSSLSLSPTHPGQK
ncbi:hypothetical protein BDZ97DRAFT_1615465, partial [Flammula alnicola]